MKKFGVLLLFICLSQLAWSQQKKQQKQKKEDKAFEFFTPPRDYKEEKSKSKKEKKEKRLTLRLFNKRMEKKKVDFWDRMEANAKEKKKIAKKMEKPQYSDPMYFGHKKKPKKRPIGKRKFCKECGIVH